VGFFKNKQNYFLKLFILFNLNFYFLLFIFMLKLFW